MDDPNTYYTPLRMSRPFSAGAGGGGGGDPFFSSVELLLINDNAANTSTTFADQSSAARAVTTNGNAQYSSTNPPSGMTTCGAFDGTGDYLEVTTASVDFVLPGDFVIDWWMRDEFNTNSEKFLWSIHPGGSSANASMVCSSWGTASAIGIFLNANTTTGYPQDIFNYQSLGTYATATWTHCALVRSGTTWNSYVGGTRSLNATNASTLYDGGGTMSLQVAQWLQNNAPYQGRICSFRVTKGSDRGWTGASITVPTLPLPTS